MAEKIGVKIGVKLVFDGVLKVKAENSRILSRIH
jgi:hypothetical protein